MQKKKLASLSPEALRRRCLLEELRRLDEAEEGSKSSTLVGQDRAIQALDFGLDLDAKGYNIFVLGPAGTGKTSITLRLIRERAEKEAAPPDICYVYHFEDPYRPLPLNLPQGMGSKLEKEVKQSIVALSRSLCQALSDETFLKPADLATAQARKKMEEIVAKLSETGKKYGLDLEQEDDQFAVVPLMDGKPIDPDVYDSLPIDTQMDIQRRVTEFQTEAAPWIHAQREQEQIIRDQLTLLEKKAIQGLVEGAIHQLRETFGEAKEVLGAYFSGMQAYILENYRILIGSDPQSGELVTEPQPIRASEIPEGYQVNVLVTHKHQGAPVEVEKEPTVAHLFGYQEYRETQSGLTTDHSLIRAGSLHKANGGYLLLQASDLIRTPELWFQLKQALRHREIRIPGMWTDPEKPRIHGTLRPLEVPMDLKIVLIGDLESYYALLTEDEDFSRIFKIKAEFESSIPWTEGNQTAYGRFLRRICKEEKLLPLTLEAIGLILEESAREVESQSKLSTSLASDIDLLCEANYWAKKAEATEIAPSYIRKALDFRDYRHEGLERHLLEAIEKGETLIDTQGDVIGQVNGLLVYMSMDYSFGAPTRITARTYAGRQGITNIDREARLSGAIHDKGSMILVGYLGGLFGQDHPLAFNASITFEQLYGEIEGDSASCAELFALLSSLSRLPIRQGVAVTGSINQQGYLQPIGGVNHKIEGMFKICKKRGLTGQQGVIIPIQNAEHLMLRDEVIEAARQGLFHIWPIHHIDEGLEILFGQPAGEREASGAWTPNSVFARVQERIDEFYQIAAKAPHSLA